MAFVEQIQGFSLSPKNPHGHGLRAPTSENLAGYTADCCTRLIEIFPSSSGCRRVSMRFFGNSRSSSKNKIHLWASEISPGRDSRPPPIIDASLAV